ncbi:MAG TPA: peptidyl-prolyl cis-trans isomerase [Vicinamibacterales bacterium]
MSKYFSVVLIVAVIAAGACRKASAPDNKNAPAGTPQASGSAPQTAAPAGPATAAPAPAPQSAIPAQLPPMPVPKVLPAVLARVNNEDIKKTDFDLLVRNIEISQNATIPAERRDEILRRVLDDLVTYTVLKQEAKARKYTATDAEVEARVNAMRKQAQSEELFNAALAQRKMTLARLRTDTRNELTIAKMMTAAPEAQPATDAEVKEFYDKNPDRFKHPDLVQASHIMVQFGDASDPAAKAKARARAEALLKRARAGEDFGMLARQNSDNATKLDDGRLPYFPKDVPGSPLPPEFTHAAFDVKTGEISDLVETKNGYHIIKVTDRKPAGIAPLADVSQELKDGLTKQKQQAFIAQLRQKAKIEVLI